MAGVNTRRAFGLAAAGDAVFQGHLLPAAPGFIVVKATLLLPAFILVEATLSHIGLGFAAPTPSWGAMLQEAANGRAIADFPWLLSPAAAIVAVVLALNLIAQARGESDALALYARVERRSPAAGR